MVVRRMLCSVRLAQYHAAKHTTRNDNQANSKERKTHTQNTTCCHSTKVNI